MKRIAIISVCSLALGAGTVGYVSAGGLDCLTCCWAVVSPYLKVGAEIFKEEFAKFATKQLNNLKAESADVFNDLVLACTDDNHTLNVDSSMHLKTIGFVNDDGSIKSGVKELVKILAVVSTASTEEKVPTRSSSSKTVEITLISLKDAEATGKITRVEKPLSID